MHIIPTINQTLVLISSRPKDENLEIMESKITALEACPDNPPEERFLLKIYFVGIAGQKRHFYKNLDSLADSEELRAKKAYSVIECNHYNKII